MSAVIKVDNVSMMFNLSSEKVDSIKDYAMRTLSDSTDEKLSTLVVDMLNYGAEAQIFFAYAIDELANYSGENVAHLLCGNACVINYYVLLVANGGCSPLIHRNHKSLNRTVVCRGLGDHYVVTGPIRNRISGECEADLEVLGESYVGVLDLYGYDS